MTLLAACSQSGPDFTLALRESSVSAPSGGTATLTLTLTPQGGFTGSVSLALERQDGTQSPPGLTLSPTTLGVTGGGALTQPLTLRVDGSVAPGSYPLRVRATSGSLARTADFTLTVGAAPDFQLTLSPVSLNVRQGGSVALEVTLTPQNGFSGSVSLAVEQRDGSPVPSGLTHVPTAVTVNANPTRLLFTLYARTDLTPGPYRLRLRASQGGLNRTADFSLTVVESATITLTVVDEAERGYAVAYQVGDGVWHASAPSSTHTYAFNLGAQTLYGVAVRCGSGAGSLVRVIQADYRELLNPRVVCSTAPPVAYALEVDVSDLMAGGGYVGEGDRVLVYGGWAFEPGRGTVGADGLAHVPLALPAGPRDLLVLVLASGDAPPKVAKVLRNVDVRGGATDSYQLRLWDVQPLRSAGVEYPAGYRTFSGVLFLSRDNQGGGWVWAALDSASYDYRTVSGFAPGDRYLVLAEAVNGNSELEGLKGGNASDDLYVKLPEPWSASPTFTETAHPVVGGLPYRHAEPMAYELRLEGTSLVYRVTVSRGWLGGGDEYKVPDLSSLLGYTPFAPGEGVRTAVSALISPQLVLEVSLEDPASLAEDTDVSAAVVRGSYRVR